MRPSTRGLRWIGCVEVQVLDVNIVLAAHRQDHPSHAEVRSWLEHGATVVTLDRDFARFPNVTTVRPVSG